MPWVISTPRTKTSGTISPGSTATSSAADVVGIATFAGLLVAGGSPWVVGVDEAITGGIVGIGGFVGLVVGWTMTGEVVVVDVDVVDVVTEGGSVDVDVVRATMTGQVVVGVVGVTIADAAEKHHTAALAAMTPGATATNRRAIAPRWQPGRGRARN